MLFLSLFIFAFFLNACSDSVTDENENSTVASDTEKIEGMIRIEPSKTTLGTKDKSFKANEKPEMKVELDYAFFLDVHEVTCGEYRKVAKKSKLHTWDSCENDSIPLSDVTYYDAVLFANAKSKMQGYDTVYTYKKLSYDSEKHCTGLEGFSFLADVDGFRLPTEAEWVLAAKKNWDPKKSWNNGNSGNKAHVVCSKGKDSTGLCDMAGNVMEWVNDWLGAFYDTTVTNYIGASDGGKMDERIVKGGSYTNAKSEINPITRGDVYTVTSSTRSEYVGFRLAFGKIPNAIRINNHGKVAAGVITPIASSETLKNYTKTYSAKLAFRNDVSGNLAYIDYSEIPLSVQEIEDTIEVYHPEISPDGEYVAFCTKYEGIDKKSELYVRKLDPEGSKLVKLDVKSAAIPRWRVTETGDTAIVYVTSAANNKDTASFKASSTWQVPFSKGKFGKPKKLFDGAYHGGISEDNSLAVSGARLLRARIANKGSTITENARDTVWYNGEQACNVSLSMDGRKRVSFLDFASKSGKKFVGETYVTHERLFIADGNGKLLQSIKAPSNYTFDHSEWATDGETSNIVASLVNANGAYKKIVLVSPEDSNVTELVDGEELWHPNLWVKRSNSDSLEEKEQRKLDPDSAGIYYNSSGASEKAIYFRYKMEFLWQYRDSANTVILGSSRVYQAVNPIQFSKPVFAINFATPGTVIYGTTLLFQNYILPHLKKLKLVITSIDPDRSYDNGRDYDNILFKAYESYPGYVYDKNHNYWKDDYSPELFKATYESPGVASMAQKMRPTRGFVPMKSYGWGEPSLAKDSSWMDDKDCAYSHNKNFDLFTQFLKLCKENDIIVIGVITPQNPKYKETGAFGYRGLRRSEAIVFIEKLKKLEETYPNFVLFDENKMGDHDYTDEMATDPGHLSEVGAVRLTDRLDSLIKTLNIVFPK